MGNNRDVLGRNLPLCGLLGRLDSDSSAPDGHDGPVVGLVGGRNTASDSPASVAVPVRVDILVLRRRTLLSERKGGQTRSETCYDFLQTSTQDWQLSSLSVENKNLLDLNTEEVVQWLERASRVQQPGFNSALSEKGNNKLRPGLAHL